MCISINLTTPPFPDMVFGHDSAFDLAQPLDFVAGNSCLGLYANHHIVTHWQLGCHPEPEDRLSVFQRLKRWLQSTIVSSHMPRPLSFMIEIGSETAQVPHAPILRWQVHTLGHWKHFELAPTLGFGFPSPTSFIIEPDPIKTRTEQLILWAIRSSIHDRSRRRSQYKPSQPIRLRIDLLDYRYVYNDGDTQIPEHLRTFVLNMQSPETIDPLVSDLIRVLLEKWFKTTHVGQEPSVPPSG